MIALHITLLHARTKQRGTRAMLLQKIYYFVQFKQSEVPLWAFSQPLYMLIAFER